MSRCALLPLATLALLAGCQTPQPAIPAAPQLPYALPTTIAPAFPASLDLTTTTAAAANAPTDPPLGDRLRADVADYATLVTATNGILDKLRAHNPKPGDVVDVSPDAAHPRFARVTTQSDHALLEVATDAGLAKDKVLLSMSYDAPEHGYVVYRPNDVDGAPQMASTFHLDRGAATFDVIRDLQGTGKLRRHQEFVSPSGAKGVLGFSLKESSVRTVPGKDPDRFTMSVGFLADATDPKLDGAAAAIAVHQAGNVYVYVHGDGTPNSPDESQAHGIYAIVAKDAAGKPTLQPVSGPDVPNLLYSLLPQEGTMPAFPPDPGTSDTFADPADTLM